MKRGVPNPRSLFCYLLLTNTVIPNPLPARPLPCIPQSLLTSSHRTSWFAARPTSALRASQRVRRSPKVDLLSGNKSGRTRRGSAEQEPKHVINSLEGCWGGPTQHLRELFKTAASLTESSNRTARTHHIHGSRPRMRSAQAFKMRSPNLDSPN